MKGIKLPPQGLILIILAVAGTIFSCARANKPDPAPQPAPAPPPIHLANYDEARAFLKANIHTPIPPDYQIPEYISSGFQLEVVQDSLRNRYPDFYGLQGLELLDAVIKAPEQYLELLKESKAIRRYYDPNNTRY